MFLRIRNLDKSVFLFGENKMQDSLFFPLFRLMPLIKNEDIFMNNLNIGLSNVLKNNNHYVVSVDTNDE